MQSSSITSTAQQRRKAMVIPCRQETGRSSPSRATPSCARSTPCPISGVSRWLTAYGLIQDNTLYNWLGEGVYSDRTSSYNVVNHNFVMNITGTGVRLDQRGCRAMPVVRNAPNTITNNVATDIDSAVGASDAVPYGYGYDVDEDFAGTQTVPAFQGADTTVPGQRRAST